MGSFTDSKIPQFDQTHEPLTRRVNDMPMPTEKSTDPTPETKRVTRACLRCRQRKSKCDLDSQGNPGFPPCQRCIRNGSTCVLGGSNRGGRRIRKAKKPLIDTSSPTQSNHHSSNATSTNVYDQTYSALTPSSSEFNHGAQRSLSAPSPSMAAVIEDTFASTNLHNTSDALNFLSQAAESAAAAQLSDAQDVQQISNSGYPSQRNPVPESIFQSHVNGATQLNPQVPRVQSQNGNKMIPYHLVTAGLLTSDQVSDLVCRFARLYHPYLPIAPKRSLKPEFIHDTAQHEPRLLTAMITVAARDLPGGTEILDVCSKYMHQLVAELSVGKRCDVEAVEALLLLAEWEPQSALSNVREVGCGEEDLAAWMHVGLALRIGYYLRLDRTSFKNDDEERMLHYNRRRLAWAACYISDRQISVRIGRAFWSRGPGPVFGNGRHNFPSLQQDDPADDDHASIFQATLELTQLFSNVNDVLYTGVGSSIKMMVEGNYVKYIDDFRTAINGWKSVWGTLTCSPNLKITLQMNYEYLRLYNSAYAFQATSFRTISNKSKEILGQDESTLGTVGALPDVRFIYESVDAAKCLLTLVNNFSHPDTSLRHFPMRFLLYCVNSAVFLYKAWSLGILSSQEKPFVRRMISDSISRLRAGSVHPCDFGSRYAQLLELLWAQKDADATPNPSTLLVNEPQSAMRSGNEQDEFSWLDLQAVGEFLTGEQDGTVFDFGAGEMEMFVQAQASRRPSISWDDLGWPDSDMNRFF